MDTSIDMDLYKIIGAEPTATTKEIEKTFRKKSLSCHPDKNPDNLKATELFIQLKTALLILTDAEARSKYDRVVNAKLQAKLRTKKVDAKRQKLINELEAREAAARKGPSLTEEQKLKVKIGRIQKENWEQMQKEMEQMRQQIIEELSKDKIEKDDEKLCRVKLKWKAEKNDPGNGGYDYLTLHKMFSKYGEIVALVLLAGKNGRGMVQFTNKEAAEMALQLEIGIAQNPLVLEGLWALKKSTKSTAAGKTTKESSEVLSSVAQSMKPDFEEVVLANLRRAEERKRLMKVINAEDEAEKEPG